MAQVLTYCTGKPFSHAMLPFVVMEPRPVEGANDDAPRARCPGDWRSSIDATPPCLKFMRFDPIAIVVRHG